MDQAESKCKCSAEITGAGDAAAPLKVTSAQVLKEAENVANGLNVPAHEGAIEEEDEEVSLGHLSDDDEETIGSITAAALAVLSLSDGARPRSAMDGAGSRTLSTSVTSG